MLVIKASQFMQQFLVIIYLHNINISSCLSAVLFVYEGASSHPYANLSISFFYFINYIISFILFLYNLLKISVLLNYFFLDFYFPLTFFYGLL